MWDQRRYRDTDYGLDPEESFEPEEDHESSAVDLSSPYIMTVLGPIDPLDLGICLPHEHLLCDPLAVTAEEPDFRLANPRAAMDELEAYLLAGGRAIVDASTRDYGRDIDGLVAIAQRVPAHIVAVTGRHKDLHASRMAHPLDVDALADEFAREFIDGVGQSRARPGVVKFGTSLDQVTDCELAAGRAAAQLGVRLGLPITTHTEAGTAAHEQLDIIESAGASPTRAILGHLDRRMERTYLESVLRRGPFVGFDQVGKPHYGDDRDRASMLVRLAEAGFASQLLISHDFARMSQLVAYGGSPGLVHMLERFTLDLMEAGADAELVRVLVVDNPARALSIHPPGVAA